MNNPTTTDLQAAMLLVQKHQVDAAQDATVSINLTLDGVAAAIDADAAALDALTAEVERALGGGVGSVVELNLGALPVFEAPTMIDAVPVGKATPWEEYVQHARSYATRHEVDLTRDPFEALMSTSQRIALERRIRDEFSYRQPRCDAIDYALAGTCGAIGGLVDALFIGLPLESSLTSLADDAMDGIVERFAGWLGWEGDSTSSAIRFLETEFKVNYDHPHGKAAGGSFPMGTVNHHLKSLGHSPDPVGLLFSLLDQFNSTASFVDNGRLITIDTETFELRGGNFVAKVFCGIVNWFGHLMSDAVGSSTAVTRGSGIPMPFQSLLQFVNVGAFGEQRQTFAQVATKVFEKGYDLRHGMALAIPVLLSEVLTRVVWALRQRFEHGADWRDCVPDADVPELRRMLVVAHGALVLIDVTDAGVRSGGNVVVFLARGNIVAWVRFGHAALVEVKALYLAGSLDAEAVDQYLDAECQRLLDTSPLHELTLLSGPSSQSWCDPTEVLMSTNTETAVLAGGCFWGMQDLIRKQPGVLSTRVGYTGGNVRNATYRNHEGHAEAIEIVFDPNVTSYRRMLEFFFQIHDPSTKNRQGNDVGTSYRSAIFPLSDAQKQVALDTIADVDASGLWPGKVATTIEPAGDFWEAEPEHQDYLERYPTGYTCHVIRPDWVLPKRA